MERLRIHALTVGPFASNCYLVQAGSEALLLDPGAEPERIRAFVEQRGSPPQRIICTHGHIDHIAAVGPLKAQWKIPVALHRADLETARHAPWSAKILFGLTAPRFPEPEILLEEGDEISLGTLVGEVWHLPGHTPGSIGIYFPEAQVFFSGDVLFQGSIGRIDLPGGDARAMEASLRRLLALPDEVRVFPGHGPPTTMAQERRGNPFLRAIQEGRGLAAF